MRQTTRGSRTSMTVVDAFVGNRLRSSGRARPREEMREALDIGEAGLKFGHDFKHAFRFVLCAKTLRYFPRFFVRTTHESNCLRRKHERSGPPTPILMRHSP